MARNPARKRGITPSGAKNLVGVAKIVVPALLPVLAPLAARAASAAGDRYDRYRAARLGVDVDRLAEYSGRGARLHARISNAGEALSGLVESDAGYAQRCGQRLAQLQAAVRASEGMPAPRRKAAHRAVAADLDAVEGELLKRLGVD
ncbi:MULTISPECIES: DUF6474 family protein [Actinosynnema]|uniref:DUF6474 family protein n=1 Tax=Actinosynnema TaxID=40566 RepID=UPI0020A5878C|nr:DUF6474 family protein [Actinosynnema pretiosum]MCP2093458.1 hypothetical protein [Actinosynnema pretiosum]